MDDVVLPAMARLTDALLFASTIINDIAEVMQIAESDVVGGFTPCKILFAARGSWRRNRKTNLKMFNSFKAKTNPQVPRKVQLKISSDKTNGVSISASYKEFRNEWDEVRTIVARNACLNRSLWLVAFEPPIWDFDAQDLGLIPQFVSRSDVAFALIPIADIDARQLESVTSSQEFQLGALLIVMLDKNITLDNRAFIEEFLDAPKIPPHYMPQTQHEFLQCFDDEYLVWRNFQPERLRVCKTELHQFCKTHDWDFIASYQSNG